MLYVNCMMLGTALLLLSQGAQAQTTQPYSVVVESADRVYPAGASIPIGFVLSNHSSVSQPLRMDDTGKPTELMRLLNQQGIAVPDWPRYRSLMGTGNAPKSAVYTMPPGERILFRYDLAQLFALTDSAPGKYSLQFFSETREIAASEIAIFATDTIEARQLNGAYDPLQLGESYANAKASVRLSVVEATESTNPMRWLLIDEIVVAGKPRTRVQKYALPVDTTSSIDAAQMDYCGQVWVILKSGDRYGLVVWLMNDLAWRQLVPVASRRIAMGTALATMPFTPIANYNIVIAGVEGETKFTTQSVWAMPRAEPAAAPANAPAARPAQ
jgi:hypothetical protein